MLQHQSLDRVFQCLSDPSRRAIVDRLARGSASVSELAQPLAMSLAAVVQHVQSLEASGLIRTHKAGRVRHCELDREALAQAEQWFSARRQLWERSLDRLGELLAAGDAVPAPSPPPAPSTAAPARAAHPRPAASGRTRRRR